MELKHWFFFQWETYHLTVDTLKMCVFFFLTCKICFNLPCFFFVFSRGCNYQASSSHSSCHSRSHKASGYLPTESSHCTRSWGLETIGKWWFNKQNGDDQWDLKMIYDSKIDLELAWLLFLEDIITIVTGCSKPSCDWEAPPCTTGPVSRLLTTQI